MPGVGVTAGVATGGLAVEVVLGHAQALLRGARLLRLALVVALLQSSGGFLAGLDLLGKLDLEFGGEQLVLTDRGQVLADQVGGEPTAIIGELAAIPLTARLGDCHRFSVSSRWSGAKAADESADFVKSFTRAGSRPLCHRRPSL
jgi:hypothetical protein